MHDLSAPIRATWTPSADADLAAKLYRKLVDARVLFLEIEVDGESVAGVAAAVSSNPAGPILTMVGRVGAVSAFVEKVPTAMAKRAELVLMPPHPDAQAIEELKKKASTVKLGLVSRPGGVDGLGACLALASATGVAGVVVSNPHAPASPLRQSDLEVAKAGWDGSGEDFKGQVHVHDLFLAELLGLDPFAGYTGCAAAKSLAHLNPQGILTACRTLPLELGDLKEEKLVDIWKSGKRVEVMGKLDKIPGECGGCHFEQSCRGGCPGLSDNLGRDKSCPGVHGSSGAGN